MEESKRSLGWKGCLCKEGRKKVIEGERERNGTNIRDGGREKERSGEVERKRRKDAT